jgi:hypothetical protein
MYLEVSVELRFLSSKGLLLDVAFSFSSATKRKSS